MTEDEYNLDRDLGFLYDLASDGDPNAEDLSPAYADLLNEGDRYLDPAFIAEGGSKQIFRAFDTKTKRQVAIGRLHERLDKVFYEPFLLEAQLTASLSHPNIINIHDIGVEPGGRPFFSMDLMRGSTLEELVEDRVFKENPKGDELKLNDYLDIFLKICDAVAYAHGEGVIHLDLKPANIYVNDFGEVIVCDWGLAKVVNESKLFHELADEVEIDLEGYTGKSLLGEIKGTPGYMAPEQVVSGGEKDARTDVYALGAILYSILTRSAPMEGLSIEKMIEKTRKGVVIEVGRIKHSDSGLTKGLKAIVKRAMSPDPEKRYSSVKSLQEDIQRYKGHIPTYADSPFLWERLVLLVQRNVLLCCVLFMAATIVAFTSHTLSRAVEEQKRRAETQYQLLDTYKETAQDEIDSLTQLSDGTLATYARVRDRMFYTDPGWVMGTLLEAYDQHVTLFPDAEEYWRQRFYFEMIRMNFKIANETALQQGLEVNPQFIELASRFKDYRFNQTVRPSLDEVIACAQHAKLMDSNFLGLFSKMVYFDAAHREDKSGYGPVVQALLEHYNQEWLSGIFNYDPVSQHLVIGGTGLSVMHARAPGGKESPFLSLLPLRSVKVIVPDSWFSLKKLANLDFSVLDISETPKCNLSGIESMHHLETLIVRDGQLSAEDWQKIPNWVEVKYQ
ncbi:MAG: serine/threonine-protein kinase [Verrucomicrobiota bacterium]